MTLRNQPGTRSIDETVSQELYFQKLLCRMDLSLSVTPPPSGETRLGLFLAPPTLLLSHTPAVKGFHGFVDVPPYHSTSRRNNPPALIGCTAAHTETVHGPALGQKGDRQTAEARRVQRHVNMVQVFHWVRFFMMVFGNVLYSHINFLDRLKSRLQLREVVSEEESDIIIAFVAVVSRAGTDIEAALHQIPQTTRPVVLVVLHHTFDPYFVAPDSRLSVDRNDIFVVDGLFHEDQGLLRCERNDQALKEVTDYLISKGVSAASPLLPENHHGVNLPQWNRKTWLLVGVIIVIFVVVIVLLAYFLSPQNP
ncbi:hypothetical protein AOLI_G00283390 [Acnodon oligacanthus]